MIALNGCTLLVEKQPGIGDEIAWRNLPGWENDNLIEAWPALLSQCEKLRTRDHRWDRICTAADHLGLPNDNQIRRFFEYHFVAREVVGQGGTDEGLVTGYYEPLLFGSRVRDERFAYPIYSRPESLLVIDLGEQFPSLKGKRVRGRLVGNRVIPFFDRAAIDGKEEPLKGNELLWVDDPYGAFFLQIQGSGRIQLPDGSQINLGYADQNGHQYVAIGRKLVEWGELQPDEVSLFTIRDWLERHPERAQALLNQNPSYVFFILNEGEEKGPRGSLNVPLTPERSIAVDRSVIPLGTPVWLSSSIPSTSQENNGSLAHPYRRLMFAQDTGGAITGPVRADVFFGHGERAKQLAGHMKQSGSIYALIPKQQKTATASKPDSKNGNL